MAQKRLRYQCKGSSSSTKVQLVEDCNEENASSRVPPEIWARIFELVLAQQPKYLPALRLTCRKWRDVINENFKLKIKINDDKMEIADLKQFRQISHCIISKFVRPVQKENSRKCIQLFNDPKLVTILDIQGNITRQNFQPIVAQCHNVQEFSFMGAMLTQEAKMFETSKLRQFTIGIKKLVVTSAYLIQGNVGSKNLIGLLKSPMPNLTSVVIRASLPETFKEAHLFRMIRQCHALESLELTLYSFNFPAPISAFSIPTLTTLKINLQMPGFSKVWLAFLNAQNSLKYLRLFVNDSEGLKLDPVIQNTILKFQKSLEHLELGMIQTSLLDTRSLFQPMVNLKSLKMWGKRYTKLKNLRLLPTSLETLYLKNFWLNRRDLNAIENRITNLIILNYI